jgi:hypothetical protein
MNSCLVMPMNLIQQYSSVTKSEQNVPYIDTPLLSVYLSPEGLHTNECLATWGHFGKSSKNFEENKMKTLDIEKFLHGRTPIACLRRDYESKSMLLTVDPPPISFCATMSRLETVRSIRVRRCRILLMALTAGSLRSAVQIRATSSGLMF